MTAEEFEIMDEADDLRLRRNKTIRIVCIIALFLFAILFFISAGMLGYRLYQDRQNTSKFAELQALMDAGTPVESETVRSDDSEAPAESSVNPQFVALHDKNADFIGWVKIEDTALDYPVMYAPDRKDFYLRKDFDGNYSDYGVPYIDEDCTVSEDKRSTNLVIYGHHMKTGTMFGSLPKYTSKEFFTAHPYIEFDTLYDSGKYEVFAAFTIDVVQDDFAYHTFIDMDEETFNNFVDEVIARSPVQSGIRPVYGEDLITMSTCEYSHTNGRMVVVARRVSDTATAGTEAAEQ